MIGFVGSYLYQLDSQGRISLPAPYRKRRAGEAFVLLQTKPHALSLYPEDEWSEVQDKLRRISKLKPQHRNRVLGVTASAVEVVPDLQGRILIPKRLREAVPLRSEALVVGAINHVEIWEPNSFEAATAESDPGFDEELDEVFAG